MHKLITAITTLVLGLALAGTVFAAEIINIRMEQPKTPTNSDALKITVVTLDRLGRTVTVKCFKKAPSDAGFVQWGPNQTITPDGGNSVTCDTSGAIITAQGNYLFKASAEAGVDTAESNAVSVDFDTIGPGTPTSYSKEKIDPCSYKITFRTADDAGQTVRVEIYRSENTTFNLDGGTHVGTVMIGSGTNGEFTNTLPDCNKTYYYAIRAFDAAGNASDITGDSEIHTTTTTVTTTTQTTGAAGAVAAGTAGNILGQSTGPTGLATDSEGQIQGDATPAAQEEVYTPPVTASGWQKLAIGAGAVILLILAWVLRKK